MWRIQNSEEGGAEQVEVARRHVRNYMSCGEEVLSRQKVSQSHRHLQPSENKPAGKREPPGATIVADSGYRKLSLKGYCAKTWAPGLTETPSKSLICADFFRQLVFVLSLAIVVLSYL